VVDSVSTEQEYFITLRLKMNAATMRDIRSMGPVDGVIECLGSDLFEALKTIHNGGN